MTQTTSHPPQQPAGEPNVTEADRQALHEAWNLLRDGMLTAALKIIARHRESDCREAVEAATKPLVEALSGMVSVAHRLDFDPETRLGIATAEAEKALALHESLHRHEEGKL